MIRKKPAPHLMRGGFRFSLGTNARRLPGDHAPTRKIERDDDSKKSHPALAPLPGYAPFQMVPIVWQLRLLPHP